MINWWAVTTIGIWVSSALAAEATKNPDVMMYAIVGSVLLGFFYGMVKKK